MAHPQEPSLEKLREIRTELYAAPSTDENLKKIRAIEHQIARREKEQKQKGAS